MSVIIWSGGGGHFNPKLIRCDKLIEMLQKLPGDSYISAVSNTGNLAVVTAEGPVKDSYSRDEETPFVQVGYIDLMDDTYNEAPQ